DAHGARGPLLHMQEVLALKSEHVVDGGEVQDEARRRRLGPAMHTLRRPSASVSETDYQLVYGVGQMLIGHGELARTDTPDHGAVRVHESGEQVTALRLRGAKVQGRHVLVAQHTERAEQRGEGSMIRMAVAQERRRLGEFEGVEHPATRLRANVAATTDERRDLRGLARQARTVAVPLTEPRAEP